MFSCDFCKVLKNTFFTEYFQESAFELISLRIFYVWISENRCQNVKKYFRCYSYCYSTISVGTWGGRSSMQDQLKTISLSPLNLEKRLTAKKCRRIRKLWRQNINYDGKNMPSCIMLTKAKLDWLIGRTSMRIATQKQERCLRRKYVIYSISELIKVHRPKMKNRQIHSVLLGITAPPAKTPALFSCQALPSPKSANCPSPPF